MAIYALSDLHLHLSVDKPMDVFGDAWKDYVQRIDYNWRETVTQEDTVLIAGDVSWATYIEDAYEDFCFIEKLPGKKIISKGNHDYWWETVSKLNRFAQEEGFQTIRFLHNDAFVADGVAICGAKGYTSPQDKEDFSQEDEKFYRRELGRLELSLKEGKKTGAANLIAMLHYPPTANSEFAALLSRYEVQTCIYGHLHGRSAQQRSLKGLHQGVGYVLTAADYLQFQPVRLT